MLAAVRELQANQTWAQEVAAAGRHLATEVLHPDNVARSETFIRQAHAFPSHHMQALLTTTWSGRLSCGNG